MLVFHTEQRASQKGRAEGNAGVEERSVGKIIKEKTLHTKLLENMCLSHKPPSAPTLVAFWPIGSMALVGLCQSMIALGKRYIQTKISFCPHLPID